MGWGSKLRPSAIAGAVGGGLFGTMFAPVIAAKDYMERKAQREVEEAQQGNENLARSEIQRRAKNLTDVREAYGQGDTATAKRMGSKLQGDVRAEGRQAGELATSQNLAETGQELTAANAAAAATGNVQSSSGQQAKAGVMGRYLQGRQQSALAALTAQGQAQGALDRSRLQAENSAITGGMNIQPLMAANNSIGQLRAAKANLPMDTAAKIGGNILGSAAQSYAGGGSFFGGG